MSRSCFDPPTARERRMNKNRNTRRWQDACKENQVLAVTLRRGRCSHEERKTVETTSLDNLWIVRPSIRFVLLLLFADAFLACCKLPVWLLISDPLLSLEVEYVCVVPLRYSLSALPASTIASDQPHRQVHLISCATSGNGAALPVTMHRPLSFTRRRSAAAAQYFPHKTSL